LIEAVVPSRNDGPEVGLCTGKDCRHADGYRTVQRELRSECTVLELPCLDVCRGVVVVVAPRSREPEVLERLNGRGLARELVDHVVNGVELTSRLRKRRLTGSARAKARRRVTRAL
jgi:hydrogenase maturation factor